MDNLTHTLSGLVVRRAGLGSRVPGSGPLLAVAANFPDVESLAAPFMDKPDYLLHHRGFTHSLAGALPLALALAGAAWGLGRWAARRRPDRIPSPPPFLPLLLLSLTGIGLHLFLDWINTYGVRLLWPFSDRWFYGDLAFIIDPWIWLILGGSCVLASPPGRREAGVWLLLGLATSAVAVQAAMAHIVPWGVPAAWFVLLGVVAAGALWRRRKGPAPALARAGTVLLLLHLVLLAALGGQARRRAEAEWADLPGPVKTTSLRVSVNPRPGIPWHFQVTLWTESAVFPYRVDALADSVETPPPYGTGLGLRPLDLIRDTREYRAWKFFARQPVARREGDVIVLGDARYRYGNRADWTELRVPIPAP